MHPDPILPGNDLKAGPALGRPEECRQVALDCAACTNHSATAVARLCHYLDDGQQRRTFFQLYPDPACSPALKGFLRSYRKAAPQG
jgi:hypothetical protein